MVFRCALRLVTFAAILLAAGVGTSRGAVFTVTSEIDAADASPGDGACDDGSGACTLRAAVQESNATTDADGIVLPEGRYTLTIAGAGEDFASTGDLDVRFDLSITGDSAASTIVDANGIDRIFHVVSDVPAAVLTGVTLRGGRTPESGGAVYGGASLQECIVVENEAGCGALATDCGAGEPITMDGVVVARNLGGGICDCWGGVTVVGSRIERNGDFGLFTEYGAHVEGSVIARNDGVGLVSSGESIDLYVFDTTVSHNAAGGVVTFGTRNDIFLFGSTVSGNSAVDGGGVYIDGDCNTFLAQNTTISGNSAVRHGGGVHLERAIVAECTALTLASATVSRNVADSDADGDGDGGGVYFTTSLGDGPFPDATLKNSVVAENEDRSGEAPDCGSRDDPYVSEGHNVIGDATGCAVAGDTATDLIDVDARLAALTHNGGRTRTHALLAGSPAIDAVPIEACDFVADQRGVARPQGSACDMGAYESLCAGAPRESECRRAGRAQIQIADGAAPGKDKLAWQWKDGDETLLEDLGNPVDETQYALCVHDHEGGSPRLAASLSIRPSAAWSPWSSLGYRLRDSLGTSDGVVSATLRAGRDGNPRLELKAAGVHLALPSPATASRFFAQEPSVTVQLVNSRGLCWTSEFPSATTLENDGARFKANSSVSSAHERRHGPRCGLEPPGWRRTPDNGRVKGDRNGGFARGHGAGAVKHQPRDAQQCPRRGADAPAVPLYEMGHTGH